jgi:hypothetical protein
MDTTQASAATRRPAIRLIVRKVVTLAVVIAVFAWLYAWMLPRAYPPGRAAGFGYGMLHGALMPLSLPSLVTGRDVQIYDNDNTGRLYKIGYICGVDLCGIAFIGPLFWRPRKVTSTSPGKSQ